MSTRVPWFRLGFRQARQWLRWLRTQPGKRWKRYEGGLAREALERCLRQVEQRNKAEEPRRPAVRVR